MTTSVDWLICKRCGLHKFRRHVIIGEGDLPCDVFIVGEAPGKTEDVRARPFIGASGQLLRNALERAKDAANANAATVYITNVLACRPTDQTSGPNRTPTDAEAMACLPRLRDLYQQAQPKTVLTLGKTAKKYMKRIAQATVALWHPAYILRRGGVASPEYTVFVRELTEIFKGVV